MSCTNDVSLEQSWEGSDLVVMARVYGAAGVPITQADVTSLAGYVYVRDSEEAVGTFTPVVSSSVYDTLQTGMGWSEDETGFNFRYVIDGDNFPDGGEIYRVEIIATPLSGSPYPVVVLDVETLPLVSQ